MPTEADQTVDDTEIRVTTDGTERTDDTAQGDETANTISDKSADDLRLIPCGIKKHKQYMGLEEDSQTSEVSEWEEHRCDAQVRERCRHSTGRGKESCGGKQPEEREVLRKQKSGTEGVFHVPMYKEYRYPQAVSTERGNLKAHPHQSTSD